MLHKQLELEIDGSRVLNGVSLGSLSVSVVFRDVESVASAGISVNNINDSAFLSDFWPMRGAV